MRARRDTVRDGTGEKGGRQLSTEPTPAPEEDGASAAVPLLAPRDGLPPVIDTASALAAYADALARGSGPVAVDAERASGYRYG